MQIRTFDGFPSFTEEQIKIDSEEAWEFIKTIHAPNLNQTLQKEMNIYFQSLLLIDSVLFVKIIIFLFLIYL